MPGPWAADDASALQPHLVSEKLAKTGVSGVEEVEVNIQPLVAACRPICGPDSQGETLQSVATVMEPMQEDFVEIGAEWCPRAWDWPQALEELRNGSLRFEELQPVMAEMAETTLGELQERLLHLAQLVSDMREEFRTTLKEVTDSGNTLLSAAGDLQRNRNIVFKMVPATSRGTRQAAEELMLCRTSVLGAAKANGEVLQSTQLRLRPVHLAVARALRGGQLALTRALELLKAEGEFFQLGRSRGWFSAAQAEAVLLRYRKMLEAVVEDGMVLRTTGEELSVCRKTFRRAILVNRSVIRQADLSLQCDQEIVFNWALGHVSNGRKCDRNFIMTVVEANGEALEQVPEEFQGDREIVLVAVQRSDGWALQFAAGPLKRDREIVLAAVSRSGFALEHAADELKRDREVVLAAVRANGEALEFAAEELRNDREVVLAAVLRSGGMALSAASRELRGDPEIALACVRANGLSLEHVSAELREDGDLVMAAVQANGLALEHAAAPLRGDRAVVLAALRSNAMALRFASEELRACGEVVAAAVRRDGYALEHASESMRCDRGAVLAAVREGGAGVLEFAGADVRGDPEMLAVAQEVSSEKRRQGQEAACDMPVWQSTADPECVRL